MPTPVATCPPMAGTSPSMSTAEACPASSPPVTPHVASAPPQVTARGPPRWLHLAQHHGEIRLALGDRVTQKAFPPTATPDASGFCRLL